MKHLRPMPHLCMLKTPFRIQGLFSGKRMRANQRAGASMAGQSAGGFRSVQDPPDLRPGRSSELVLPVNKSRNKSLSATRRLRGRVDTRAIVVSNGRLKCLLLYRYLPTHTLPPFQKPCSSPLPRSSFFISLYFPPKPVKLIKQPRKDNQLCFCFTLLLSSFVICVIFRPLLPQPSPLLLPGYQFDYQTGSLSGL